MNTLVVLILVFVVAAAVIAIWSAVKPAPILWIAVLLLCIVEAIHSASGLAR